MRLKVGDTWHGSEIGKPVMIELSAEDKRRIANMHPECTRIAYFENDDPVYGTKAPERDRRCAAWMDDGAYATWDVNLGFHGLTGEPQ